jgi:hypothetical protein
MKLKLIFLLLIVSNTYAQNNLKLIDHPITLKKNISFKLKIPEGYKIAVAAEGLNRPRFFAKAPDGRLFVTDMYDRSDNSKGKIYTLGNWTFTNCTINGISTSPKHISSVIIHTTMAIPNHPVRLK